jgi:hypothetical protein
MILERKLSLSLLIVSLIIVLSLGITGVVAKDIAYIVGTTQNPTIISAFNSLNYSYDIIPDVLIATTNFSSYSTLVIQDSVVNQAYLPLSNKNLVFFVNDLDDSLLSSIWPGTTLSKTQTTFSKFEQLGTPFTKNFSSLDIQVYTSTKEVYYLRIKPSFISRVALTTGSSGSYGIINYANSTKRQVMFGTPVIDSWATDTLNIFKNSIIWATEGADADQDGYYSDFDCNDSNVLVWKNYSAYRDLDLDGFGASGLLSVCGGANLPSGYSIINSDCNDSNALVYPGAIESLGTGDRNCVAEAPILISQIPNQSWNQDTNLTNAINLSQYFADVDKRTISFTINSTGVNHNITIWVTNGIVSFTTLPGWSGVDWVVFKANNTAGLSNLSNNITLKVNYVNYPPILTTIGNVSANETSLITILANATDKNNDAITYTINDSKFTNNGNGNFSWQTNYGNAGNYSFLISASDGNMTDTQEVFVYLNDLDRAPIFTEIPNITINESSNATITLEATDQDNDTLTFYVASENISKVDCSINGSSLLLVPVIYWNGNTSCSIIVSDGKINVTKIANIEVLNVNNAPITQPIANITSFEKQFITILLQASDDDTLNLNYTINDSRFTNNGNGNFSWQTNYGNAGVYELLVTASDGILSSSQRVKITIYPKILINEFVPNPDSNLGLKEWIELYNPSNLNANLSNCKILDASSNDLALNGVINNKSFFVLNIEFYTLNNDGDSLRLVCNNLTLDEITYNSTNNNIPGLGESLARKSDGFDTDNISDFTIVNLITKGFSNTADMIVPVITLISPVNQTTLITGNTTFNYSATDNLATTLNCSFYSDILNNTYKKLSSAIVNNSTSSSFWASDIPNGNYKWQIECTDGTNIKLSETRVFTINAPLAPVIRPIANITLNEGQLATILANATDANNDSITYVINDSKFTNNGNGNFTWQTNYSDSGNYSFIVQVSDSIFNVSQIVYVKVIEVVQPPYFGVIPDFQVQEDSDFYLYGQLPAFDLEGQTINFSLIYENTSQVDCFLSEQGSFGFYPIENWAGTGDNSARCIVQATNSKNGKANYTIKINVTPVNDAPIISSYSPAQNTKIHTSKTLAMSVNYSDIDTDKNLLSVQWYKDKVLVGNQSTYLFIGEGIDRSYNITAIIKDGSLFASQEWNITTTTLITMTKYDGVTTNLSSLNRTELSNVYLLLEKIGFGRIQFINPINLSDVADLDSTTEIQKGLAAIDTNALSSFRNNPAIINLYNLNYTKKPTIYYNSGFNLNTLSENVCPDSVCTNITYSNGNLQFAVSGFSTFFVGDVQTCSQKLGDICTDNEICTSSLLESRDSDKCCASKCTYNFNQAESCAIPSNLIELKFEDLDDNDDFEIGDTIKDKLKIKNKLNETKNFDVYLYLYDLDKNNDEDKLTEKIKVRDDDSEDLGFEFLLDKEIEVENDLVIYAYVEDRDNSSVCNSKVIPLKVDKKDHEVVFNKLQVAEVFDCSKSADIDFEIENMGADDEDVYVLLENKQFGINVKSSLFELKETGSKSKVSDILSINLQNSKIPSDIKNLTLQGKVIFKDGSNQQALNLQIPKCTSQVKSIASESSVILKSTRVLVNQIRVVKQLQILCFLLIIGIIILILLAIVLKRRGYY